MWSAVGVHDGVHDVVRVIREASPGARPEQVWGDIKGIDRPFGGWVESILI